MSLQSVSQVTQDSQETHSNELKRMMRRLHTSNRIALGILGVITTIVALIFLAVIIFLVIQGFSYIFNASFYSSSDVGIGPELFNTFYILILSEILLFPLSLAAAIYLNEYAPQGPLVTAIHFAAETLAGVPSIVLGLFGALLFGSILQFGTSRLTGALTLLCLNFPLALRLFEEALAAVPRDLREGGLALGGTKWHVIRTAVIPSALPGIITGLILTAGKIIGEAAALIFTMGIFNPANVYTMSPLIASDTLTTHLYFVKTAGAGNFPAATANAISSGTATMLILILLVVNLGARGLGRFIQRRITAA